MSLMTVTFTRPTLEIQNSLVVPVLTDADGDGDNTLRKLSIVSLTFTILLDSLAEESFKGRSYTDDQATIYRSLESKLSSTYGLEGRACLQRFICELQKFPIHDRTIVGELITAVFTPKEDGRGVLHDYREAQRTGQRDDPDSCSCRYAATCPLSLFSYFDPGNDPDREREMSGAQRGPNDL